MKHEDDLQLRWLIAAVRDLESRYPNVTSLGAASLALVGALQEAHDWNGQAQRCEQARKYQSWLRRGLSGFGWR